MTNWEEGLFEDTRYPAALHHVLFVWNDDEEDLQCAALGWFLLWRKHNTFVLDSLGGHFARPVEDPLVWLYLKERILDWAWLEQGGLNLENIHTLLLERHHYRITWASTRKPKNLPTSVGIAQGERNVRKSKQSSTDRTARERSRDEGDNERPNHGSLFVGHG